MPNTTNYSFPTPADTDLVKNGADAIRDLGDAVDTAMNTALGTKKSGLVLLNTTSFSGVTSQSFNNVFSASYDNYLLVGYTFSATGTPNWSLRLRSSGTDASGANYNRQYIVANNTTVTAQRSASATSFDFQYTGDTTTNQFWMQVTTPFLARETIFYYPTVFRGSSTNNELQTWGGGHSLTNSYDGFSLLSSTSNSMSGKVSVYGYNI
jgi:hypothetical protein